MRAPMGYRLVLLVLCALGAVAASACGKEIGDSCILGSDCSPNGDRVCLCSYCSGAIQTDANRGYCTVLGCDVSTCPQEAACVRFFTGSFENRMCTVQADCSLDELCAINGHCVPRASEVRYCMKTCSSNGDCRDGYECRDLAKMKDHGGEPVLEPGTPVDEHAPKFCAAMPP
jgi:hypothetical protein